MKAKQLRFLGGLMEDARLSSIPAGIFRLMPMKARREILKPIYAMIRR